MIPAVAQTLGKTIDPLTRAFRIYLESLDPMTQNVLATRSTVHDIIIGFGHWTQTGALPNSDELSR